MYLSCVRRLRLALLALLFLGSARAYQPAAPVISTEQLPYAAYGTFYETSIQAVLGSPPFAFSLSQGSLPAGLSLSREGRISGITTDRAIKSFQVKVIDSVGRSAEKDLIVYVVDPGLRFVNESLPDAVLGSTYLASLNVTGGSANNIFFRFSGNLPFGLSISSGGLISGTPTRVGTYRFELGVDDVLNPGRRNFASFSMEVRSSFPRLDTATLAQGQVGQPYSQGLVASGGVAPYRFSVVSANALPSGLSMDAGGVIRGTPTTAGTSTITIRAVDAAASAADRSYSLNIRPAGLIFDESMAETRVGAAFSYTLRPLGGRAPYTMVLSTEFSAAAIPSGLEFDPSSFVIRGASTESKDAALLFRVFDATGATALVPFRLVVYPASVRLAPQLVLEPFWMEAFRYQYLAGGGTPPYRFDLSSGTIPPGLALSSSGLLSGTPSQRNTTGSFIFVRVTDARGGTSETPTAVYVQPRPLTFGTDSLEDATVQEPYRLQLLGWSERGLALSYRIAAGALPAGIQLSPGGQLEGSPAAVGRSVFTVEVRDSQNQTLLRQLSLQVNAKAGPLRFLQNAPPRGFLNYDYSSRLPFEGGEAPLRWSVVSGWLPPGLSIDEAAGELNGVPLVAGFFSFRLRAEDSRGNVAEGPEYAMTILDAAVLPAGLVGRRIEERIAAPPGRPPVVYSLAPQSRGGFPFELGVNPEGRIEGTSNVSGEYQFAVNATDADGVVTPIPLRLSIRPSNTEIPEAWRLPGATVGIPYRFALRTKSGARPLSIAGGLPNGLSLDQASGSIVGTPTLSASFSLILRLAGIGGGEVSCFFQMEVRPAGSAAVSAVANAASYASGGVAAGQLITIFGDNLGPAELTPFSLSPAGFLPTEIAGTRVLFDGRVAPLLYSSKGQLSAITPFTLSGQSSTAMNVLRGTSSSSTLLLPVLNSQPALFTVDGSGTGQGAILNQDGSRNGQSNPAAKGSIVVLYATGGGRTTPSGVDGRVASAVSSLFQPAGVQIGGQAAELIYAGNAPGIVEGVIQVNARVPQTAASGSQPVRLSVGGNLSPAGVVLWVQ